ncbi:MAG: hypothetical protein LBK58_07135 [Prevotellaceae bacterium]|jgi:hypothetical protein|nr:hypothetical protein [Prevotellaceae bacterium]
MRNFGFKIIMMMAAILPALAGEAKLKGLPVMKTYKNYSLVKKNVESIKYTVYAPKVEGETVTKGEIADFIAEIFFDEKGYRVKEIVYNIETQKVDVNISWVYDEKAGTVIETRTDPKGKLLARTEYLVNYKTNTVLARRYQDIEDYSTGIITPNVLIHEELWTEDAKRKKVIFKKTYFDFNDGVAAKQSISEENMEKPYTLYSILEDLTMPIDYTWLYDYNTKALKASSGNTKKELIFDGTRYEYKTKSKLLSQVLYYGSDKKLKNITSFIYTMDRNKNWTELIQKEDDKPSFIVQRDIKYKL